MNYPLISEYVEAIKMAEDNFEELSYLRPVLDDTGQPVMSSGNFDVVFKMGDEYFPIQYRYVILHMNVPLMRPYSIGDISRLVACTQILSRELHSSTPSQKTG